MATSALVGSRTGLCMQRATVTRSVLPARISVRRSVGVNRQPKYVTRAELQDGQQVDVDKVLKDLGNKWDRVENKTTVAVYAVGAVALLWLSTNLVGSINNVPLLPKVMELVGLGYSAWFTYRYLLFKSSREELIKDVEELKKKITGAVEE